MDTKAVQIGFQKQTEVIIKQTLQKDISKSKYCSKRFNSWIWRCDYEYEW